MRPQTLKEVQEQYGGMLPPDAVLRPDDAEIAAQEAARDAEAARRAAARPEHRTRSERFAVLNTFVAAGTGFWVSALANRPPSDFDPISSSPCVPQLARRA